ncbi:MAG: DUF4383 domain-containing protein [Thermoleophilaceae bacterium]|nr:DUF4383 domain-containing protein [Thermoleophilaceae bacterium]
MTSTKTPAQLYSLVFGATLLVAGIAGFLVDSSFGPLGSDVEGSNLILFEVNGIHNIVHLASGALGLALWRNPASARLFALGFGAVYLLVTVLGFAMGTNVLGIIPINAADNVLHLTIAAVGLVAGLASRTVAEPTMSARA